MCFLCGFAVITTLLSRGSSKWVEEGTSLRIRFTRTIFIIWSLTFLRFFFHVCFCICVLLHFYKPLPFSIPSLSLTQFFVQKFSRQYRDHCPAQITSVSTQIKLTNIHLHTHLMDNRIEVDTAKKWILAKLHHLKCFANFRSMVFVHKGIVSAINVVFFDNFQRMTCFILK